MKALAERLTWARERKGLSQAALAKASGVSQSTIGNLEAGIRLTSRKIAVIANILGVDALWLAEGKGKPFPEEDLHQHANIEAAQIGMRRIPLISYVQAGTMTEAADPYAVGAAEDWLLTDLDLSGHAFALRIKGDSMLPDFKEGDVVIIDPAVQPIPGDYVVAKNSDEEATFKRYKSRGLNEQGQRVFELVPINDDYEPIRSDITPIRIIGTMMEHRRFRKR